MQRWTKEKAWEWYRSQRWIRGFNGYPSNCVNRVAMWQSYKHREVFEEIEREFELAKETGLNAVRAIVQFEVWLYEHDSFMSNLEEYFSLADRYGIKVMLVLGNDCNVPKDFYTFKLGEQPVDWGYHSGIKRGQHSGTHTEPGYQLNDEPEYREKFYQMADELAAKYARDERLQIWDVWNELGAGRRGDMSLEMAQRCFEIIRSHDPIQPLTAECWIFDGEQKVKNERERTLVEWSDIVSFHYYGPYPTMVKIVESLKETYDRPIINSEWLNRIDNNNVEDIFPLFYLEKIGSYHWGLIQGFSQTYEPWGGYLTDVADPDYYGPRDLTKWQHDLYRFNGLPYIAREIAIIRDFASLADRKFEAEKKA